MKSGKVIDISKSSLVSLKAELSRKQEEVKKAKETESYIKLPPKPKETVKTNAGVEERSSKDLKELEPEEIDLLKKSREVLEVKSRLYDELQKGNLVTEEGKTQYLVDFNQKEKQSSTKVPDRLSGEKAESSDDDFMEYDMDENEWVEYTDCLGRTRKCHHSELAEMKKLDAKMAREICLERKEEKEEVLDDRPAELVSSDMERERFRQKWEEQEKELLNKKDIHYEDILFDEARAHGVGYFKFSRDEGERRREQELLRKVREETESRQKEARLLRERREGQRQARLIAARQRQRARLGLPPLSEEEILKDLKSSNPEAEKEKEEEIVPGPSSVEQLETVLKKTAHVRPWDVGKEKEGQPVMSQEEWVDKQRSERKDEFAPMYTEVSTSFDPTKPPPLLKKRKLEEQQEGSSEEAIEAGLKLIREQVEREQHMKHF